VHPNHFHTLILIWKPDIQEQYTLLAIFCFCACVLTQPVCWHWSTDYELLPESSDTHHRMGIDHQGAACCPGHHDMDDSWLMLQERLLGIVFEMLSIRW
jgi:hypothetical protein